MEPTKNLTQLAETAVGVDNVIGLVALLIVCGFGVVILFVWYLIKFTARSPKAQNGMGEKVAAMDMKITGMVASMERQRKDFSDHAALSRDTRDKVLQMETKLDTLERILHEQRR